MQAGKLSERITVKSRSVTLDAYGQEVVTWVDLCTVWAQVVYPMNRREDFGAGQIQEINPVHFIIRYRTDIDQTMRVVWNGRNHDIEAVAHVGHVSTRLKAIDGVRDGRN
jgi:SPP1 family predicted phage head-tail adaptor